MSNNNLNSESSQSQVKMIVAYLEEGNTITSLEALKLFGCLRLASRICDIRERGYDIAKETITLSNGKRVTQYKLNNNGN